MMRVLLGSVMIATLLNGGCSRSPVAPSAALEPVPRVPLDGLESPVRHQIEAQMELLQTVAARADTTERERADTFGDLGLLYHAYGFLTPAAACYRNAILLDPGERAWRYYLAHVLLADGDLQAAEAAFRDALDRSPDDVATRLWLAEVLWKRGEPEATEVVLRRALDADPDNASILFRLGQLAAHDERFEEAVDLFERTLRLQPWATSVRYPLATAYRELGDEAMARRQLELRGQGPVGVTDPLLKVLEDIKRGSRTFLVAGAAAMENARYEDAAANFERAVEADPEDDLARLNLGAALTALGRFSDAGRHLRFAAEEGRTPAVRSKAWFNLGLPAVMARNRPAAVAAFGTAIEIDADNILARRHLADIRYEYAEYDEALKLYESIVTAEPSDTAARISAASCCFRLGRQSDSLDHLETAHGLFPDDDAVADRLAQLLATASDASIRDPSRALEIAIRLYSEKPTPRRTLTLAMAQAGVGDFEEAIDFLSRARTALGDLGPGWLADKIERDIETYRARRPCREPLL